MKILFTLLLLCSLCSSIAFAQKAPWGDQGDGTYVNPILSGDFSDPDVIRVGSDYYLITSTFQYAPGMAVMHSKDLVNWQYIGHCIDDVSKLGPNLNWDRMNRYNRGVYAGSLRYHAGKFWMFTTTMDEGIFMTTAVNPAGPWEPPHRISDIKNTDDPCPLWDDDGQAWLVYSTPGKAWKTHLVKMSADGRSIDLSTDTILDDYQTSEGNKLYKFGDTYYVFHNEVRGKDNRVGVFMRSKSMLGPWEKKLFMQSSAKDRDREPNQGALIDTPDGKGWYFITQHGRGGYYDGRPSSMMPVTWIDGWPTIEPADKDGVGTVVFTPLKKPIDAGPPRPPQSSDDFDAKVLGPQWEWNYQPRPDVWSLTDRPGFMRIRAIKPLANNNFLKVPNTLTQRVLGRDGGTVVAKLDVSAMADDQQAGLSLFDSNWTTVGVVQHGGTRSIVFNNSGKSIVPGPPLGGDAVWLKYEIDPKGLAVARFSLDGKTFEPIGDAYPIKWANYRGARIGLYSYNESADGGHVDFDGLDYSYPAPGAATPVAPRR